MAARSFWKGYLKLSLVTCRVALVPAQTEAEKVRFHTLNRRTGNRVESRSVDAVSGKTVAEDDVARGYRTGDDTYLILEDEELDAVTLDSARTIDIESFVPEDSVAWIWYDTPHYLVPDDTVGAEAFAVIREAMAATGTVGIARLVLYRRERAVLLKPRDRGLVLWTLRYGEEVRGMDDYAGAVADEKPDAGTLSMIVKLIQARKLPWDPKLVEDPVQDKLLDTIAAKKKGRRTPAKLRRAAEPEGNVVNIMDALKRSLAAEKPKRR
jgi:DNA end-binding protein Ku